jgi:hypothetical protein
MISVSRITALSFLLFFQLNRKLQGCSHVI